MVNLHEASQLVSLSSTLNSFRVKLSGLASAACRFKVFVGSFRFLSW